MTEPKELSVITAFGESVDSAIVLAAQPDEEEQEFGAERTLVLRIEGGVGRIVDVLPSPVVESWRSESGKAYCTSNGGQILTYFNGTWDREKVCQKDEYFRGIWGFGGKTDRDDIVIICSNESLYVRDKQSWSEYPMPQTVEIVKRIHGLSPDEVYVCTDDGLLCWNGKELKEIEGPDDELRGVLVLSDQKILVTGDRLHLWSDKEGWRVLDSPAGEDHTHAILPFGDDIFIGTLEGILRLRGSKLEIVLDSFCNTLVSVGDAIIAAGDESYLFDGKQWVLIQLPKLAFGEDPK